MIALASLSERPSSRHLVRPSLLRRLEAGRSVSRSLSLVRAAAGYGKSELIVDYARYSRTPVAALPLTRACRDPAVAVGHLQRALERTHPEFRSAAHDLVRAAGASRLGQALEQLLEDLLRVVPSPILVLDNIERLGSEPEPSELLEWLVELFPAEGQLVIVGRDAPPLRLAQYRLRERLVELTDQHLAFSLSEVEELCERLGNPNLAPVVWERTRGWPAGVGFLLADSPSPPEVVLERSANPALLYEFLVEEVLRVRSPEEQESLLQQAQDSRSPLPEWVGGEALAPLLREALQQEARRRRLPAPVFREEAPSSPPEPAPAEPPPEATRLEVDLLGPFRLRLADREIREGRWSMSWLMLAYLLLNPQGVSKEQLYELIYADREPARSALHTAISRLRASLDPEGPPYANSRLILFQKGRYHLHPELQIDCDVCTLEKAWKEAERQQFSDPHPLERVIDRYRGEFLEGVEGNFWCEVERQRLRMIAIKSYDRLFAHYCRQDAWEPIERLADRLLGLEPENVRGHQVRAIALACQERREDALRGLQPAARLDAGLLDLQNLIAQGKLTIKTVRALLE